LPAAKSTSAIMPSTGTYAQCAVYSGHVRPFYAGRTAPIRVRRRSALKPVTRALGNKYSQVALGFACALAIYLVVGVFVFFVAQRPAVAQWWTVLPNRDKGVIATIGELVFVIAAVAVWRKRRFVSIGILLFLLADLVVSVIGY